MFLFLVSAIILYLLVDGTVTFLLYRICLLMKIVAGSYSITYYLDGHSGLQSGDSRLEVNAPLTFLYELNAKYSYSILKLPQFF